MIQVLLDHFFCQVTFGIVALANLSFRFSLQKKYQFGINWGAININVNEKEGIISESDQYYYLYGINFDYHF